MEENGLYCKKCNKFVPGVHADITGHFVCVDCLNVHRVNTQTNSFRLGISEFSMVDFANKLMGGLANV